MYKFKILIADLCVEVSAEYSSSERYLQKWLISEDILPDVCISINNQDIAYEKALFSEQCRHEGIEPKDFKEDYFESASIFRKIAEVLPFFDGFAFHGSAVCVDDATYIFSARSGVGKSTHVALWQKLFPNKAVIVNDDKPFLRIKGDTLYAYGSPWNGKNNLSIVGSKPVRAICFIERNRENHICEISLSEACGMLMQQSLRPRKSDSLLTLITLLNSLDKYIRFYKMGCNMDISAARMSYDFMSQNTGANLK